MEGRENTVFGRKVFFLNPTLSIQNVFVRKLQDLEYEVYTIENYADAKPVLSEYEDAICFINIDDQLTYKQWFNFIKSFESDSSLDTVLLGVISEKIRPHEKEEFLLKTKLAGGFISTQKSLDVAYDTILKILDINGAKGRRKYVRLDCSVLDNVEFSCALNNKLYFPKLEDISSVGFSCRIEHSLVAFFRKGLKCSSVNIRLGIRRIFCSADIFAVKPEPDSSIVVFLFDENTPLSERDKIKKFIALTLQERMNDFISNSIKDTMNYSKEIKDESESGQNGENSDTNSYAAGNLEDIADSTDSK